MLRFIIVEVLLEVSLDVVEVAMLLLVRARAVLVPERASMVELAYQGPCSHHPADQKDYTLAALKKMQLKKQRSQRY